MPSDRTAWNIADELTFIAKLGTHTEKKRPHIDCVIEYLNAIRHRQDWGTLDKKRVYEALMRESAKA